MTERSRRPNGASSIYLGADGRWHGRVTVGVRDDGSPDRRHIERATEAEVIRAVRELERGRESGNLRRAGQTWTVQTWLEHWLTNISAPSVRPSSYAAYEVAVRVHLVPGVGAHRLDKLQAEHLERLYAAMLARGSKPATVHQAHRTIRAALNAALRRGHVTRNVATIAHAPRIEEDEIEPYTVAEVHRLLEVASNGRNGARWAFALALGLRQGEALGLTWADVDLDNGILWVRRTRVRPQYEHGCDPPCGRERPGYCPDKRNVRGDTANTKSRAGRRGIGLPDPLVELLRRHRTEQTVERETAGQLWRDEGWLFADPLGRAVNMNTDHRAWKALLEEAGLRETRLHDARHTAATVLLVLGIPDRAVMGIMGWSHAGMAARYQHITGAVRRDVARQVGGLLWPDHRPSGPEPPGR
ncbi:site-specific integrase [Sporichthya brevicatena]|uniref:Site-specific integrase n=1 Tax=Sporichthya brevicatena TaxID=171442 RepID=A0ABN1HA22_9ACTN